MQIQINFTCYCKQAVNMYLHTFELAKCDGKNVFAINFGKLHTV